MKKIIVVTGASSGFGALASRALAKAGHIVYSGMRDTKGRNASQVAQADEYAAKNGVDLRTVELDVQSDESVEAGINRILAENKRLDIVVHNERAEYSAREPRGIASVAKAEEGARSVGFEQQRSRRNAAISRTVLRSESGHGCDGRSVRTGVDTLGHRDVNHCSGSIHWRHESLRARWITRRQGACRRIRSRSLQGIC